MAKKERKFYNELDFLRHQVRELAAETGTVIKDTNFMKKEECKGRIKELYKRELKKEVDQETKETIENLKNEVIDRNNQITALQKEKVELENAKSDYLKEIIAKTELIKTHEKERRELQEINQANNKTIKNNIEKLAASEKELQEKKRELAEFQSEIKAAELSLEKLEKLNKNKTEIIENIKKELEQLKNRKWYHSFLNFFKL